MATKDLLRVSRHAKPKGKAASAESEVQNDAHSLLGRLHHAESQVPSQVWLRVRISDRSV